MNSSDKGGRGPFELGCGTLILIALIVMIFSNRGTDSLENRMEVLRRQSETNRVVLNSLSNQLEQIRLQNAELLDALGREPGKPDQQP